MYKKKAGYTIKRKLAKKRVFKRKAPLVTKPMLYRAINRSLETKLATESYTLASFNGPISGNADFLTPLPSITIGTDQNNRIGHSIRPIKLVIRGYVAFQSNSLAGQQNADAALLGVRLFCFRDRATSGYQNAVYNTQILNVGGVPSTYSGSPMSFLTPHNSDQFIFYTDKRMKICKPYGYTNNATPTTANAITGMDPSMYHPFTITLTQKQLPASLKYDALDSTGYPVNFAPYMALGYSDLLTQSIDSISTRVCMEWSSTLYFKDA